MKASKCITTGPHGLPSKGHKVSPTATNMIAAGAVKTRGHRRMLRGKGQDG